MLQEKIQDGLFDLSKTSKIIIHVNSLSTGQRCLWETSTGDP